MDEGAAEPFVIQVAPPGRGITSDPSSWLALLPGIPPSAQVKGGVLPRPARPPTSQVPLVASIISFEAHQLAETYQAEGSETSEEGHERFDRLKLALEDAGFSSNEVGLTLQTEFYMLDLETACVGDTEIAQSRLRGSE